MFDIRLQGETVAADYDIIREAGGPNRAVVAEFQGVKVEDLLAIELVPNSRNSSLSALPTLQGIEVIRERFVRLGATPPAFVMNDFQREQTAAIRLVNRCDDPFVGTLRLDPPEGFTVSVPDGPVRLAAGQRLEIPVTVTASAVKYPYC